MHSSYACTNCAIISEILSCYVIFPHCIDPDISVHPVSLLVPMDTQAVFTCQAYCTSLCDIYWIIGNITVNPHHKPQFESKGYVFSSGNPVKDTYTARVTINASLSVNGTEYQCYVTLDGVNMFTTRSSREVLLIVTGMWVLWEHDCVAIAQDTMYM